MSACWIGTVAARHVAIARAEGFVMFSHGRHTAVASVRPGDRIAYYSPREGLREGAEVRAFTAIGEVLPGGPAEREMMPGLTGWYRPARWYAAHPADVYPLLDRLSFVTDRRHWGVHFRRSLFKIPAADFDLVAEAMGAAVPSASSSTDPIQA